MKVGDELRFKKFKWKIVKINRHISGYTSYEYRVYRKYFRTFYLTNTKCRYDASSWRWEFLKNQLKKDPSYHYNMSLWSNNNR